MFKQFLIAVILYLAGATLQVYSPECKRLGIPGQIEYTLSNFGEIPYGQTVIGQIRIPKNPELCDIKDEISYANK